MDSILTKNKPFNIFIIKLFQILTETIPNGPINFSSEFSDFARLGCLFNKMNH